MNTMETSHTFPVSGETPMTELRAWIQSKGYDFVPEDLNDRWQIARCTKTNRKLWYRGIDDGQGFARFSFGECADKAIKFSWKSREEISEKEQKEVKKYFAAIERAKEKHQLELAENIESTFKEWEHKFAGRTDVHSSYLFRKGFGTEIPSTTVARHGDDVKNVLCVPMRDEHGRMWSMQQLYATKKKFWPGSRTKGCWFEFPQSVGNTSSLIYVGEGFASCLAVHKATNGARVLCAFSANNLESCVKALIREGKKPEHHVLLADWDGATRIKTGKNPGMIAVQKLCAKYHVGYAMPGGWSDRQDKNWDFGDTYKDGLNCVPVVLGQSAIEGQVFEDLSVSKDILPKTVEKPGETCGEVAETARSMSSQPAPVAPPVVAVVVPPLGYVGGSHGGAVSNNYGTLSPDILPHTEKNRFGLKVFSTLENLEAILRHVHAVIRYNVIKKEDEWFLPGENPSVDNQKKAVYARIQDLCMKCSMPIGQLDSYLSYLADNNQYNPVLQWIDSVPWDGVKRWEKFFETVVPRGDAKLRDVLIRRWMLSAVAAASRPNGINASGLLVFQGPQYVGKTKWFRSLVPKDLDLAAEGLSLNPADKDSVKQTICYWLVELGEIDATFKKSDLAALKAFITRDRDTYRAAYARQESHCPRRTVFFGSVNKKEFLADETGNRRYWVIECEKIQHDHDFDMQQVWAEVAMAYRAGEQWWLTEDEMRRLNESNKDFEVTDHIEELIASLDWSGECDWQTATDIYMKICKTNPNKRDLNMVSHVVRQMNGGKVKKTGARKLLWCPKWRPGTVPLDVGPTVGHALKY